MLATPSVGIKSDLLIASRPERRNFQRNAPVTNSHDWTVPVTENHGVGGSIPPLGTTSPNLTNHALLGSPRGHWYERSRARYARPSP
jgi:hypothetical protein